MFLGLASVETRLIDLVLLANSHMNYDPSNVFARILRGELPSAKIYEDDAVLAFLDVMPRAPGHSLVIPKVAAAELTDLDANQAAALIVAVQKVASALRAAMGAPGVVVAQLNGAAAGQTVFHVHFHVIPALPGFELKLHGGKLAERAELEATAQKIRDAIRSLPSSSQ